MNLAIDAKALLRPRAGVARYLGGVLAPLRQIEVLDPEVELVRPPVDGSTVWWTLRDLQRASPRGFDVLHCPFYYGPVRPRCPITVATHDLLPVEHLEWPFHAWVRSIRWLALRTARRTAPYLRIASGPHVVRGPSGTAGAAMRWP